MSKWPNVIGVFSNKTQFVHKKNRRVCVLFNYYSYLCTLRMTKTNEYGQAFATTAARQHGGHPVEGHEAGDDCASRALA